MLELKNEYLKGVNNYPPTFVEAFSLLLNYQAKKQSKPGDDKLEISMLQREATPVPGIDGEVHPLIQCFKCKKMGHYASNCPKNADHNFCQLAIQNEIDSSDDDDGDMPPLRNHDHDYSSDEDDYDMPPLYRHNFNQFNVHSSDDNDGLDDNDDDSSDEVHWQSQTAHSS